MDKTTFKQELSHLNKMRELSKIKEIEVWHERIREKILKIAKTEIKKLPNVTVQSNEIFELRNDLSFITYVTDEDHVKLALQNITENVRFHTHRNGDYYGIHFDFLTEGDNNE